MKIEIMKQNIAIEDVIESYTPLRKMGSNFQAKENPLREEKTSSFHIYTDTQRWFDFGSGEGGDIVDFIKKAENLGTKDAIFFLSENYLGDIAMANNQYSSKEPTRKPEVEKNNVLLRSEIDRQAKKYLSSTHKKYKSNYSALSLEIDGIANETIRVSPAFEKLFEGYLIPTEKRFADYLFSRVLGYDSYFNCAAIILREEDETVVDIVRYRPERDGKPLPMKYLYMKNSDKPDSNYLFPLQAQMQKIMMSSGYAYVGEGLKNAINASILGIPFISIESASSIKAELILFLKSDRLKNIVFVGAFDGDSAGEKAYKKVKKEVSILSNKFDFNSGMDFSDYLKEIKNDKINNR